jgi:hypothetical protein
MPGPKAARFLLVRSELRVSGFVLTNPEIEMIFWNALWGIAL